MGLTGKVLVLGDDDRAFLAVIRSLGRRGLTVHVGWHSPDSVALHSKYVARVHDIPRYSQDREDWKEALTGVLERERFDLVIPCNDRTLMPLHAHRAELGRLASLALPNEEAFAVAFNKAKSNELARSLGLNVPRETRVSAAEQADEVASRYALPVVLKPQSSFTLDDLERRHHVRKVYSHTELLISLRELLEDGEVLVQENFIGAGVGVELLAERGEILVAFQHLRIHEPITGGGSTYRKSVALTPELLDAAGRLMKALSYSGVAMVEFKVDLATGNWVFIEINGRFWGSLPLALAAGADFPYYLYQMMVAGGGPFSREYRIGIYGRNLLRDITWLRHNLNADRSDPTLQTVSLLKIAAEIFNVLSLRERLDTIVADDPRPGLVELSRLRARIRTRLRKDGRAWLLSLKPLRRLSAKRVHEALTSARKVLFLCKGNTCRSPFAKYYAEHALTRPPEILSAGYHPKKGRSCPEEAVASARALGINLSPHRSTIVDEKMVRDADMILVFDDDNRETVLRRFPSARHKVYSLAVLDEAGTLTIPDPYGKSIDHFNAAYQTIMRAVEAHQRYRESR